MTGPIAFTTVWRPGSGTQWIEWDRSDADFSRVDAGYLRQGLRLVAVGVRDEGITGVWQPGSGTQWVWVRMSDDDFVARDAQYLRDGLRIAWLTMHRGRLAAVWRPGDGVQWVHWGLSPDEFRRLDLQYFRDGLRIQSLTRRDGAFAAVWRPGGGGQWVHWDMTSGDLAERDRDYFARGFRITALVRDGDRYAAVWRTGSGTQWYSLRRGDVDFRTEDGAYLSQGLRVAALDVGDSPTGAYRYPWKGGDTRRVTQGNNNPSGSHNGVQAWAFDFGLPAGTEVRAARAGTVEWVRDDVARTFDPTKDAGPGNEPFPDGDPANWGNIVRLRHAGGFTSWYFHLQQGGMRVAVGDEVRRGQVLALSGNTGRSSGPHLHFQVQADSTDWGMTVPVTFGSACRQPAGGDDVTSDNAS